MDVIKKKEAQNRNSRNEVLTKSERGDNKRNAQITGELEAKRVL